MTQLLRQRFQAVRLFDSTHCPCSDALAKIFPGCGGGGGEAGIKVLLSYDYGAGQLHPLAVLPANCSDQGLADQACQQVGQKELGIFDKGFYKAQALRSIQARGGYFLLPWHHSVSVWEVDAANQPGAPIDVAAHLKASTQSLCGVDRRGPGPNRKQPPGSGALGGLSVAARGMLLPPYDTTATLERLGGLMARYAPCTVVALGDNFHDGGGPGRLAPADRATLFALQRGRDWILDRRQPRPRSR